MVNALVSAFSATEEQSETKADLKEMSGGNGKQSLPGPHPWNEGRSTGEGGDLWLTKQVIYSMAVDCFEINMKAEEILWSFAQGHTHVTICSLQHGVMIPPSLDHH